MPNWNPFRKRETGETDNDPSSRRNDTGYKDFLHKLHIRCDEMIPLPEVGDAIHQGLQHNPSDNGLVTYELLSKQVEQVIQGLCKQRGQELLQLGINQKEHSIPNVPSFKEGNMTLKQTIEHLENLIDVFRKANMPRGRYSTPYAFPPEDKRHLRSVATAFLTEMGSIYEQLSGFPP